MGKKTQVELATTSFAWLQVAASRQFSYFDK